MYMYMYVYIYIYTILYCTVLDNTMLYCSIKKENKTDKKKIKKKNNL